MFKHGNWIFCLLEINLSLSSLHSAQQPSFMTSAGELFLTEKVIIIYKKLMWVANNPLPGLLAKLEQRHHGRQSVYTAFKLKIRESYLLKMFYETKFY